jgi:hypothetical protein
VQVPAAGQTELEAPCPPTPPPVDIDETAVRGMAAAAVPPEAAAPVSHAITHLQGLLEQPAGAAAAAGLAEMHQSLAELLSRLASSTTT